MTQTILIDAAHKEETRVAVLENGILQDFDRDALAIKQIKGNIYLAKITRVEASLQAAFVDYGSDKHGFLPFSDIHPDYYQLTDAEKQKIKDLTSESHKTNKTEEEPENTAGINASKSASLDDSSDDRAVSTGSYSIEDETGSYTKNINNIYKKYNIQDVIKPNQVVLVQVLKEERGSKGASMTTYISIAGKYCVLMANTPNKGGVSKKVSNFRDRKILRTILDDLNIPTEKSVIIRTAGVGKRPEDLKRDYDYLVRLWNSIRETTLSSEAPCFIHAEDDIIKRCIRDVYSNEVKMVAVEGKEAYETVSNFIRLTMPEGAGNIKLYEDRIPIFNKYKVEQQINSLYEKQVKLHSGGSIVIDHAEALVAIDVNSGKSTGEKAVEATAYNTNLEAAKEIARQLRLRDLAGLVVIDFIDMYDQKNKRLVERALRDGLRNDRARIQLGKISIFGLLEMSRQRLGASFFEIITDPCYHCNGTGYVRSTEIVSVSIFRAIRHTCTNDKQSGVIHIYTSGDIVSYILNYKRNEIIVTEKNYNIHIIIHHDDDIGPNGFNIKKKKSLSVDEKRELDMEVSTGKVNQLGIERDFIDEVREESNIAVSGNRNNNIDDNFNNNYRRSKRRQKYKGKNNKNYHQDNKKLGQDKNNKSVFSTIFSLFSK